MFIYKYEEILKIASCTVRSIAQEMDSRYTIRYMTQKLKTGIVSFLFATIIFVGGFVLGNFKPLIAARVEASKADITTFWKVWNLLDEEFVTTKHRDPATSDEDRDKLGSSTDVIADDLTASERRIYGAIKGMVDSEGDPYTTFFSPSEAKSFETEIKGSFEGIGMEVGKKDGILTAIATLPGSPSERAGLKTGDKILKIDTKITTDMTVDGAVQLIRGKKGTQVHLTVYREGVDKPLEFTLTRDTIQLPSIDKKFDKATGVYTIKIYSFSENISDLFKQAIQEFKISGSKKLVIDLRGNPGGYLDSAVDIASWFVPQGKVIVSQDYGVKRETEYLRSVGYQLLDKDVKVAVLVDGGSASASEIVAGALQDYKAATLIGQKTFGKGSVQEYIKVTPNTGLKITIARWLTPNGRSISIAGLVPDIEIKNLDEDVKKGLDAQYQKAVEILSK